MALFSRKRRKAPPTVPPEALAGGEAFFTREKAAKDSPDAVARRNPPADRETVDGPSKVEPEILPPKAKRPPVLDISDETLDARKIHRALNRAFSEQAEDEAGDARPAEAVSRKPDPEEPAREPKATASDLSNLQSMRPGPTRPRARSAATPATAGDKSAEATKAGSKAAPSSTPTARPRPETEKPDLRARLGLGRTARVKPKPKRTPKTQPDVKSETRPEIKSETRPEKGPETGPETGVDRTLMSQPSLERIRKATAPAAPQEAKPEVVAPDGTKAETSKSQPMEQPRQERPRPTPPPVPEPLAKETSTEDLPHKEETLRAEAKPGRGEDVTATVKQAPAAQAQPQAQQRAQPQAQTQPQGQAKSVPEDAADRLRDDGAPSEKTGTLAPAETGPAPSRDVKKVSKAALQLKALQEAPNLKAMVRRDVVVGMSIVGIFASILVVWSALAPLSSAAIAPGVISPQGSRKTVQHLEGGIIKSILVADGDEVKAGEPLVLLEDTMAQASYSMVRNQYYTLVARHARLTALQTGDDQVYYPQWLTDEARDPDVAAILASEDTLLETRRQAHNDRKAVLQERISQYEKEIDGLNAQISGQTRQLQLIGKEIAGVQELVNKGLERRPRLLGLQRNEAEIRAQQGANTALIAKTEQAINATELELISADADLQDEVAREMSDVQAKMSDAGERLAASSDILNRIEIRAPVGGKVIGLKYHTAGGIIAPGSAILDIVPDNEELLIEARVSPMDIDVVYESLKAQIHLSAFAQRNLPRLEGTVRHVSADRLVDQVTGQPYFLATVEIDPDELKKIGEDVTLTPGMPAEVMIVTGNQTLLDYLLSPAIRTLRHAFREG